MNKIVCEKCLALEEVVPVFLITETGDEIEEDYISQLSKSELDEIERGEHEIISKCFVSEPVPPSEFEGSESDAEEEGWTLDEFGWLCPNHSQVDEGHIADIEPDFFEFLEKNQ